ncbi:MAG: hypothetical protein FD133_550 [Erysipelotrichaceae bacterium]|nr:MAG: hypothetical protein FD179_348 [Erysipelotrichaceae bacterium]TXT19011.1 MAG: hypothetical protein FD133_550 [Erysipelotrichaceae bacterium]
MKGIMMAVGLFVLSMGVTLGLMYYISFEQLRLNTVTALKQSLIETLFQLDELAVGDRYNQALTLFSDNFKLRKHPSVSYQIDLMGFIADPLALRIRIDATDIGSLFELNIQTEETMIEVEHEIE